MAMTREAATVYYCIGHGDVKHFFFFLGGILPQLYSAVIPDDSNLEAILLGFYGRILDRRRGQRIKMQLLCL